MIEFLADMLRGSLSSKLRTVIRASRSEHFELGKQIHCHLSKMPQDRFGFSASIITSCARRGDVGGVYHFFASRGYPAFRQGLFSLTAEVARAAANEPTMEFFRVFAFCKPEDVDYYLSNRNRIADSDGWLEKAVRCDWRSRKHLVREHFVSGSWTPATNGAHEVLDLVSNEVREVYPLDAQQLLPADECKATRR
jgi:hypothetical protein